MAETGKVEMKFRREKKDYWERERTEEEVERKVEQKLVALRNRKL